MIAKDFAQQLFNLQDRVAFVTGAGSGIGQMIAYGLASAGARVVGFDLREDGGLAETVSHHSLEKRRPRGAFYSCSLLLPTSPETSRCSPALPGAGG